MYDPEKHHRRSLRLKDYDYSQAGAYFVTLCTHERECSLGEIIDSEVKLSPVGNIVRKEWKKLSARFSNVQLDAFVVMPNHIHGIIMFQSKDNVGVPPRRDGFPNTGGRDEPCPYGRGCNGYV